MTMKRFIIISLLEATVLTAGACGWMDTYNYYLFSPYDTHEFRSRVEQVTNDNWKAYMGSKEEYFYFEADEVAAAARRRGDQLMVSYVENLKKYLDCADEKRQEQWDYPTKEQLARRTQTLRAVRTYAQGKLGTRLRSQHALLLMRCNMMLGQHQQNVTFYEQTGSKMIESVYRDMMKNIYAGALYKTGHDAQAGRLFAEMGDWESLMTQYYKRRSFEAIRQEYQRDASSAVLPFLLKDFVNNAQEAIDAEEGGEGTPGGKLFIRDIQRREAQQMIGLAARVVSEGRSPVPAMWQSAKAWLEFMYGDRSKGLADIEAAAALDGTARMKDNVRVLRLYMKAALGSADGAMDNFLAAELTWLDDKTREDDFFANARGRLVHHVLGKSYGHRPTMSLALMKALCSDDYDSFADTMDVERLKEYLDYVSSPASTALDRFVKPRQKVDRNSMNDLVGTKYMRQCRWSDAVEWLGKVPVGYYEEKGYAVYAVNRKWTVEPWLRRQWLSSDLVYGDTKWHLQSNPKLAFAREMLSLESSMKLLSGEALCQKSYDAAVRYAQASFTGDCWFLMRDGKSVADTVRSGESDLRQKALTLLQRASRSADFALREKALFAMTYGELYSDKWFEPVWNSRTFDYERRVERRSQQYRAFAALADYEKQNSSRTSRYVSRCDEYIQFRKSYR